MDPYATYNAHNGRWLATLVIGLLVLATAYFRTQAPAQPWGLPLPNSALTSGQLPATGSQAFLLVITAPSLPPTSTWYPVAQWLAAGDSPCGLAPRLPEAGWPLASQATVLPARSQRQR